MRPVILLLPLLAGSLSAQGFVAPGHFAIAEGNNQSSVGPGDTSAKTRYQQIHSSLVNPATINSISLRRDGHATGNYAPLTLFADIVISSGGPGFSTPKNVFDQNHGADKTQVLTMGVISVGATKPGALPRPFEYKFPFSRPFRFPGRKSLCWEIKIQTRSNRSRLTFDSCFSWKSNPDPEIWANGKGCKATGRSAVMQLNGSAVPAWPQSKMTLDFKGANLPNAAFLSLGGSNKIFSGIPLPFLIPGSSTAASGPCHFYNDSLMLLPMKVSAAGSAAMSLNARTGKFLHGGSLFAQILGVDKTANPWGIVASNMVQYHLVTPFSTVPIAHIFRHGSLGATGTPVAFQGMVTKFD